MRRLDRLRRRPPNLLRWLGVAVVCAIAFAYVQPIRSFLETRTEVAKGEALRASLLRSQVVLRHRLAETGTDAFLEREARRLGLVRPGERLFIVKGVSKPEVR